LHSNNVVIVEDVEGLPMVRLGPDAVPMDQFDAADRRRAEEAVQIIARQGEQPVRAFLEENVHGDYQLVS
jgi:hypothetical protein